MPRPAASAPLSIVHVGNFPFGLKPGFQHGVAVKLSNGLIRNGHLVLNFSDRDVARALAPLPTRKLGRGRANAALEEFCRHHRPDVLLLGHADVIAPATVARIRAALPALRVAQWNVDPLFEPDNVARIATKQPVVDMTFVSTAGPPLAALRARGPAAFLPNPVDFSIERGRADCAEALAHDLFYACGHPSRPKRVICGREWDLDAFFREVATRLPHLRLLLGGLLGRPHLTGAAYQGALESCAIGLNASRRPDHPLYSSDRIAQLAGNGLVVLIERTTGYDTIFSEDEMAFFGSLDEFYAQLERLTADPGRRRAVAAAGRARYGALFNERAVAQRVLDILLGAADPEAMPWARA
ncbi:MAG: glycosyltransferase family 1 protein [Alphaproteobacteria bacterium]|mgnify:CR=1 FL=1|nr:glycosyltransferase family 1 protein [Alphaproteobacteria bacterium]